MLARRGQLQLKDIVAEAAHALARLDADRLEEMVVSCGTLCRGLGPADLEVRETFTHESKEAEIEMAIFSHVLEATRTNLNVMDRLRQVHVRRAQSPEGYGPVDRWTRTGVLRGND